MNVKRTYKQCVINTDFHPVLKRGQIVDIISETPEFYLVQSFETGTPEFISKKDVVTN